MRIVYSIDRMDVSGGVQRVLALKANAIVQMGVEVYFVVKRTANDPYYPLHEDVKMTYIDVNNAKSSQNKWKKQWSNYQYEKRYQQALSNALFQIRPDITITIGGPDTSGLPQIKDGSKKIYELHGAKVGVAQRFKYPKGLIGDLIVAQRLFFYEKSWRGYDRIVHLTKYSKELWGGKEPQHLSIPNPLTWEVDELALLKNKRVIAVGRFVEEKNFSELIEIWSVVAPQFSDWRLDILGDGYLEHQLKQQIERLNLSNSVQLHGTTPTIQTEMLRSSVLVLTSLSEGFGQVLTEAQSLGIPVVSYDTPCGPRDIITDGEDGFLVPMHDKKLFAERLITLMRDENFRQQMGAKARENVQRFSTQNVMCQWITLFQELTQEK